MLTDGRTHGRTDGRTDDGRKVITIAHPEQSSGELKITYFCLFISYLVPGYLKGRFCYLRGFYLETNKHRLGEKKKKKKKEIRVMPRRRTH